MCHTYTYTNYTLTNYSELAIIVLQFSELSSKFFDNGEFDVRGCVVCAKKLEFNLKAENILLCNNLIVTVQG